MRSTACWSWDARSLSASPDPGRGWGEYVCTPGPCNTPATACTYARCVDGDRLRTVMSSVMRRHSGLISAIGGSPSRVAPRP
jgi:hypothetical protein